MGQILWDENYRSVNYRYDEDYSAPTFKVDPYVKMSAVETVKLCDCYNYQTCEAPDWKETEAYAIMQAVREAAISALPGMSEAPWTI